MSLMELVVGKSCCVVSVSVKEPASRKRRAKLCTVVTIKLRRPLQSRVNKTHLSSTLALTYEVYRGTGGGFIVFLPGRYQHHLDTVTISGTI